MTDNRRYVDIAPRASDTGTPTSNYHEKTRFSMASVNESNFSLSHFYNKSTANPWADTPNGDTPATVLLFDASSSRKVQQHFEMTFPGSKTQTFPPVPPLAPNLHAKHINPANIPLPSVAPHSANPAMPLHDSLASKCYPNTTTCAFSVPTKISPNVVVGCARPSKRLRTEPNTYIDAPQGIFKHPALPGENDGYLPRNSNFSSLGTGSCANFARQNEDFEFAKNVVDDLIEVLLKDQYGRKRILTRLAEEVKSENDKKVLLELSSKISQSKMLTFIPRFESYDRFRRWANSAGGFRQIIEHLSPQAESLSMDEPKNVENIMKWISEHYPKNFKKVARQKLGEIPPERMDAIATLALMKDLNLTEKAALTNLNRHLQHYFGVRPLCTKSALAKLKVKCPTVIVDKSELPGKDENGPKEKVHVLKFGMGDMVSAELGRFLENHIKSGKTKNLQFGDINSSYFIYDCGPDKNDGIWALIGTDHGKGASQFVIRLLLLPSSERRDANSPSFGTISCPFANIRCRKESKHSLDLMTESINEGLNLLKDSKIIAVVDNEDNVHTTFIPKDATKIAIESDRIVIERDGQERMSEMPLPTYLSQSGVKRWFTVVGNINVLQIGDLSAQMILQGRSGMSPHRCIHCKLTKKQWTSCEPVVNLSESDMRNVNNTIGMSYLPLWKIAPLNCVIPVLHLFLGTVNYQLFKKILPFLSSLEPKGVEEKEIIRKIEQVSTEIESYSRDLKSRNDLCEEQGKQIRLEIRTKGKRVKALKKILGRTARDSPEAVAIRTKIVEVKIEIEMLQDEWDEISKDMIAMRAQMKAKRQRKSLLTSNLKELIKKREGLDGSMKNFFENTLDNAGIDIKVWHGGTLTGPSIMKVFRQLEQIMESFKNEAVRVIVCNSETNGNLPSVEDCKKFFDQHADLLRIQDAVYAHLRIIAPTKTESNRVKKLIEFMKGLWLELDCSLTPKAHLLFEHGYDQMVRIGGLGDKCEDPLERIHQDHDKAESSYKRLNNIAQRMKYQAQHMWVMNNPSVNEFIEQVYKRLTKKETEDAENDKARLDNSPAMFDRIKKKRATFVPLKTMNRRRRRVRMVEKMMAEG